MKAREHKGKTLRYLSVEPDGYDVEKSYPVIILLHGFGAHMGDLAGLAPAIDTEGYLYICPNAPVGVQLGVGMMGYAWMNRGQDAGSDESAQAEEILSTLFQEVIDNHNAQQGKIILGGFSQGGMMTYRSGLTTPEMFAGLAALSARISDPEGLRGRLPESRSMPIFVSHGTTDAMISVEDGRGSQSFLEAEGYSPEYHEYPMGHEITQDVLSDLVPWIHKTLPPFRG